MICICKIPKVGGWFKGDHKGGIDHEDDGDYISTLELQGGKMFTPYFATSTYFKPLTEDDVLSVNAYNKAVGVSPQYMY